MILMKKREIGWLLLICSFFVACGSDKTDPVAKSEPIIETESESTAAVVEIDFLTEEKAIKQTLVGQNTAISQKEEDDIMSFWIKSEDRNIFTAWTFAGGGFEKYEGWRAVKNGWIGIFKLRGGQMATDVSRVEIDSRASKAVLYGKYKWEQNGELIIAFQKQRGKWLIRAIDYTNGSFGKQISKLSNPAYTNPKE